LPFNKQKESDCQNAEVLSLVQLKSTLLNILVKPDRVRLWLNLVMLVPAAGVLRVTSFWDQWRTTFYLWGL